MDVEPFLRNQVFVQKRVFKTWVLVARSLCRDCSHFFLPRLGQLHSLVVFQQRNVPAENELSCSCCCQRDGGPERVPEATMCGADSSEAARRIGVDDAR